MPANRNKRRRILMIVVVFSIAITGCVHSPLNSTQKIEETKSLSVSDLDPKKIVGKLGYPLGTVVHVKGVVLDSDIFYPKSSFTNKILRIYAVNDQRLQKVIDFNLNQSDLPEEIFEIGDHFERYAYEYGAFQGQVSIPRELYKTTVTQNGRNYSANVIGRQAPYFHFSSEIAILQLE